MLATTRRMANLPIALRSGTATMILIGQYDSPFVRRVGIAMTLYGMRFEHRPWSTFGNADKVRDYNPLIRVPTLVLDDGDTLIESSAIIDWLDTSVGPARALFPATEPDRHRAIKIASLATGAADKAVALFYELRLHTAVSDFWTARCKDQITSTLSVLERDLDARSTTFWFGGKIGHADIAAACALRFITEAHPGFIEPTAIPRLAAHAAALEARPEFVTISQPFIAPA